MKKLFLSLLALVLMSQISFAQMSGITGSWHGLAQFENGKLRLSLAIDVSDHKYSGMLISPDQNNREIPIEEIIFNNNQLYFQIEAMKFEFKGDLDDQNQILQGIITQNSIETPISLTRNALESPYYRPQTPAEPYPYLTEEVTFSNTSANIQLAGTLSLPSNKKDFPIAVMITGSGPQDRDESLAYHKPFLVIADFLAKNGIGTLRFDDRGVGESEGNFSTATSEDFASDVVAALDFLKISGYSTVGTIGHSEGGLICAMVGANYPLDFIISLAGTAVDGRAILAKQNFVISVAEGLGVDEAKENNRKFMEMVDIVMSEPDSLKAQLLLETHIDSVYLAESKIIQDFPKWRQNQIDMINNPWMRFFVQYDPCQDWKKVTCPVLALNGTKDLQVDLKLNFDALQNCLIEAGNEDFTLSPLKNQNHLFQTTETGRVSEYIENEESFSEQALKTMLSWMQAHFPKR